jgi:hypothetical protein
MARAGMADGESAKAVFTGVCARSGMLKLSTQIQQDNDSDVLACSSAFGLSHV